MHAPDLALTPLRGRRRELLGVPLVGFAIGLLGWYTLSDPTLPEILPQIFFGIAAAVFVGGIVLYCRAPPSTSLGPNEVEIVSFHPRLVLAYLLMLVGLLPVGLAVYVYQETNYPYVYVLLPLAIGLYLMLRGAIRFWRNTLTTYTLTTRRIIRETRFFSFTDDTAGLEDPNTASKRAPWYAQLFGLETVVFNMPEKNILFTDSPSSENVRDTFYAVREDVNTQKEQSKMDYLAERLGEIQSDGTSKQKKKPQRSDSYERSPTPEDQPPVQSSTEKSSAVKENSDSSVEEPISMGDGSEDGSSDLFRDAIDRLDELTAAWVTDGGDNTTLKALVEKQAEQLEDEGLEVIFPEIGTKCDPHVHEVVATQLSPEPDGTILAVTRVGLRGAVAESRDAQVITSLGRS